MIRKNTNIDHSWVEGILLITDCKIRVSRRIKYIKIPENNHGLICTACKTSYDMKEIRIIDDDSISYTCPKCKKMILTYYNKKQLKRINKYIRRNLNVKK